MKMKRRAIALILVALLAAPTVAQDQPTLEQTLKLLDQANEQLREMQNRKNELSQEIQRLQKKLTEGQQESEELRTRLASLENRSYFLREQNETWEQFLAQYPYVNSMWKQYLAGDTANDRLANLFGDSCWPFIETKSDQLIGQP
jgi:peptidoglycan hydrolase CwlO-like protein